MFCVGLKWDSWGGPWHAEDNPSLPDWELPESVPHGEHTASPESSVHFAQQPKTHPAHWWVDGLYLL